MGKAFCKCGALSLILSGLIVLTIWGIEDARNPEKHFIATTGKIEETSLIVNHCQWCNSRNARDCGWIHYSCYSVVYKVEVTMVSGKCSGIQTVQVYGDIHESSGPGASQQSEDEALEEQKKRLVGSTQDIYYDGINCGHFRWTILDRQAWSDILIIGAVITGIGFLCICCIWVPSPIRMVSWVKQRITVSAGEDMLLQPITPIV